MIGAEKSWELNSNRIVLFSRFASCFAGSKLIRYVQASSLHDRAFWAAEAPLPVASPAVRATTNGRNFTRHEFAGFMTTSPPRRNCATAK